MNSITAAFEYISKCFDESVIPTLIEYIRIPNLSPAFNGGLVNEPETEQVVELFVNWVISRSIRGATVEVRRLPNRTPVIMVDIPASPCYEGDDCILLYGHLDKQPPFEGWSEGTGPYTPVIKDGRLYGRGGADDGYALFGSVLALQALHEQGAPHARAVILIEACEESGSPDLPAHLESLTTSGLLRNVSLVVCLDSGAGSYDTFWMTTSLRGVLMTKLKVTSLTEGVHSGNGGGICSDTFRVFRQLLSSIEDEVTGRVIEDFQVTIPQNRIDQNVRTCAVLGDQSWSGFPLVLNRPMNQNMSNEERALDRGWRASLTITGIDGLPPTATGGNVIRPSTTFKLSIRLPPTYDHTQALNRLKSRFNHACPPDCRIEFLDSVTAKGWNAPDLDSWLELGCREPCMTLFGQEPCCAFEGGSIPFLGMLQDMFPLAQL
jgi:acetylornithine deacetylase/succinyl-diaminopimelate desuccinylase-like protein